MATDITRTAMAILTVTDTVPAITGMGMARAPTATATTGTATTAAALTAATATIVVDQALAVSSNSLPVPATIAVPDRKSTRLNSSHRCISYAVFCLKKKKKKPFRLHIKKKKKKYQPTNR